MDPKKLINSLDNQCIAIAMAVVTLRDAKEKGSFDYEFEKYKNAIKKLETNIIANARDSTQIESIGREDLYEPRNKLRKNIDEVAITLEELAGKDHLLTSTILTLKKFSRALKNIDGVESSSDEEEEEEEREVLPFDADRDLPGSSLPKRLKSSPDPRGARTHSDPDLTKLGQKLGQMSLKEESDEPKPAPPTKSKPHSGH